MKLADTPPAACSSCFGQYPARTHVDFESAWDGPVIPGGVAVANGETVDRLKIQIDDLILCDECVLAARALLADKHPDDRDHRITALERDADGLRETLVERERYIQQLESTLAAKPKPKPRQRAAA